MSLMLEIVTPEGVVYSQKVISVVLPAFEEEIGIYPGHIPLLTMLESGEIQVQSESGKEYLAIDKGFARVLSDKVSVLTETAIDIKEIDLEAVEQAQARAEKALKDAEGNDIDESEIQKLESIIRFSLTQKLIRKKYY